MDKETAWLLEKGPAHAPQYATVKNGMLDWTPPGQHETALRMARRADADALEAQAKEIAELTQMVADLEGIRQIDVDEFNQLKTLCDLMGAALEEMLESCECDINAGRIAAREALEGQP